MNHIIKKRSKGFTLIELLVVIAIIALLANIAYASLNNAKRKSRDAKRVADIKSIQAGLEMYFSDNHSYPYAAAARQIGTADYDVLCSTATAGIGFRANTTDCTQTYMEKVPSPPTSPAGDAYLYTSLTAGLGSTYTLVFALEGGTGSLSSGVKTATPIGIAD